jgi:hypothetical protein
VTIRPKASHGASNWETGADAAIALKKKKNIALKREKVTASTKYITIIDYYNRLSLKLKLKLRLKIVLTKIKLAKMQVSIL